MSAAAGADDAAAPPGRSAGQHRPGRDRFADRGDGFLALIHPVGHTPRVLLRRVIPAFGLLLAEHNVGRPLQRQLWVLSSFTPERCSTTPTDASARP